MAELKYGELASWEDGDVSSPNDFMSLQEGENRVRVVTNPYQFIVHWTKDNTGSNRKIRCAINNCPLCKRAVKTQTRWYIGVIDRKSGQPKILEIGSQIYKGVKVYISSPEWGEMIKYGWGDVMAYDIIVQRGAKGDNPLYTVLPTPKASNLTDEEVAMMENFIERVDLSKFTQPTTPEEVAEKLGDVSGNVTPAGQQYAVGTQQVTTTAAAGVKPAIDDDAFDFGDDEI